MESGVKCSLKWWQNWWQGQVVCAFQSSLGQSLSGLFWDAELSPEPGALQTQCTVPEVPTLLQAVVTVAPDRHAVEEMAGGTRACYHTVDLHYSVLSCTPANTKQSPPVKGTSPWPWSELWGTGVSRRVSMRARTQHEIHPIALALCTC